MTKKNLKWRLREAPTVDDVTELMDKGLIDKDEAREILFSEPEEVEPTELESLTAEVKLLRELVMSLASRPDRIVEVVRRYEPYKFEWYKPYIQWASNSYLPKSDHHQISATTDHKFESLMKVSNSVTPMIEHKSLGMKVDQQ